MWQRQKRRASSIKTLNVIALPVIKGKKEFRITISGVKRLAYRKSREIFANMDISITGILKE